MPHWSVHKQLQERIGSAGELVEFATIGSEVPVDKGIESGIGRIGYTRDIGRRWSCSSV